MSSTSVSNTSASKHSFEFDKVIVTVPITVASWLILPLLDFTEWTLLKAALITASIAFLSLTLITLYAWVSNEGSIVIRLLTRGKGYVSLQKPVKPSISPTKRVALFCIANALISVLLFVAFMMYPTSHHGYLNATINNETYPFTLMSAVKGPVGKGETSIGVVYYYITPHNDIRYTLIFQMDGNIGSGKAYTERDEESKIQIILTKGFIFDVGLGGNMYVASVQPETSNALTDEISVANKSYFHFEITERDEKWEHYRGKFDANLQLRDRTGLVDETLTIDSVEFDFSITDDIAKVMD